MGNSVENIFIDALVALIKDTPIEMYNGTVEPLNSVYFARKPSQVFNDTVVVIVPKGPRFEIARLGLGANVNATDKVVAIELYVFKDGIDEEIVLRDLSNITFEIARLIMANRRLGGAHFVQLVDTDYDWASAEDMDNPGNVLAVTSAARIPIVAVYRSNQQ